MKNARPAPNPPPAVTYSPAESASAAQRQTVGYDPNTGEETVFAASAGSMAADLPADAPMPGLMPFPLQEMIEGGDEGDVGALITPTPPTPQTNATGAPWNTIFKMLMRFRVNNVDYYYVCSAWAAGSFHVVTAGHCIHNWDPDDNGDTSDRKWADEIWLWAAQGDVVNPTGTPDRPYGEAKGVHMRSYTGWINSQNLDHDWGVVTLNRRDGDRTGWMGRETATTASLNFSGYPAETPYVPAGTLVQYKGYDDNNVWDYTCCRINLDAYIYGGHSGGPSWRFFEGDLWVQGIHSTSNRTGSATDTYLTSGKRSDLNGYMSTDATDRPPTARPDLIEYFFDGNNSQNLLTNVAAPGARSRSSTTPSTPALSIRVPLR